MDSLIRSPLSSLLTDPYTCTSFGLRTTDYFFFLSVSSPLIFTTSYGPQTKCKVSALFLGFAFDVLAQEEVLCGYRGCLWVVTKWSAGQASCHHELPH